MSKARQAFQKSTREAPAQEASSSIETRSEGKLVSIDQGRSSAPFGVNLIGYLTAELGVGQSLRNCMRSLKAKNIPFSVLDISSSSFSRLNEEASIDFEKGVGQYPVNLFHVNADCMPIVLADLDRKLWENKYNIGFWHWELPVLPEVFSESFAGLDEVWTCSQFVANAISPSANCKVAVLPHSIDVPILEKPSRASFGLPDDMFLFLVMYDMLSFHVRKNPMAALEAFAKIDAERLNAGLVIKVMNSYSDVEALLELEEAVSNLDNCYLLDETLSRSEVTGLQSVCDSFVSLHRSEGYGLCLAESMFLGKPVIATNWSGNVDFMNESNSCPVDYSLVELRESYGPYEAGQIWAEPSADHAAHYMDRLVRDELFRKKIGERARGSIRETLSPEVVGSAYMANLKRIIQGDSHALEPMGVRVKRVG